MTPTHHHASHPHSEERRATKWTTFGAALALGIASVTACGGSATNAPKSQANSRVPTTISGSPKPAGAVLPVTGNPITNTATERTLSVDEVLVENNVDPTTGKATDDHLEIVITNTGSTTLTGFEVFYTIKDSTTGESESYYTELPRTFEVSGTSSRTIHFDNKSAPVHFPDNPYSLYHTSLNGLDVTVEVSAQGAAPQTASVKKDPGGDEVAD